MTGVLYMLLGSASVGLSFVYAKKFLSDLDIPPVALTTYQIGLALLTLPSAGSSSKNRWTSWTQPPSSSS